MIETCCVFALDFVWLYRKDMFMESFKGPLQETLLELVKDVVKEKMKGVGTRIVKDLRRHVA